MKNIILAVLAINITFASQGMDKTERICPCNGPGFALDECHVPAAYSKSSRFEVCGDWNIFTDLTYNYWYICQDQMQIAVPVGSPASLEPIGEVINQPFNYKSGFRVGIGLNTPYDGWVWKADYTWVRSESKSVTTASAANLLPSSWLFRESVIGTTMKSHWKLGMDIIDLLSSRPFYSGQKFTVAPYCGLRALWVRQSLKASLDVIKTSKNFAHSWALGPRAGVTCNWLLCHGFRTVGDVAASVLYTKYTKLSNFQTVT